MGKPSLQTRPSDDGMSLHTQPGDRFLDDDAPELQVDDLPPLYEDAIESANGSSSNAPLLGPDPANFPHVHLLDPFSVDAKYGTEYYLDESLDTEPETLEKHMLSWAKRPPRPFVRLLGTHSEMVDSSGKKERKTVTDFDVQVELTPYLYSDATRHIAPFSHLYTVENEELARRGTVFRTRGPGASQNIEIGLPEKPTLAEWCHRYCASHAGLKSMVLQRRFIGFDELFVRRRMIELVHSTNYRGHLQVEFPVRDQRVEVFNKCKINQWRLTGWIFWLCTLTLTVLFTWPYLFFRTKRFEVVRVDWAYSVVDTSHDGRKKYASISEEQWYNMWGRAISRAVLQKQQSTLDQHDLLMAEGAAPDFSSASAEGALGFLMAGVVAMGEVNRHLGWGGDS
ncbi:hypothetical protein B0H67DRAFT_479523 [Lasiosphaeris hirsuta]|uniref:Uncharacterized protein n=1 Tax=Lasiosphaeris hirsuta TaxID=260670 RepID=A0AA40B034_9PEZI|nr:hypothetical protein B0H67DRAFT_479523 [Lasiosphaeris hirsuta]